MFSLINYKIICVQGIGNIFYDFYIYKCFICTHIFLYLGLCKFRKNGSSPDLE